MNTEEKNQLVSEVFEKLKSENIPVIISALTQKNEEGTGLMAAINTTEEEQAFWLIHKIFEVIGKSIGLKPADVAKMVYEAEKNIQADMHRMRQSEIRKKNKNKKK